MNGIIYIAFGRSFTSEALISAESIKRFSDIPITLFTDNNVSSKYVDDVKIIKPKHIRCKVDFISQSPYKNTLYLDSDTLIMRDISDMFDVLDRFEIGVTHDYARKREYLAERIPEYSEIPYSFSEINGGIMSFNNSEKVQSFFELWKKYFYKYYNQTEGYDQASLRISLWESKLSTHYYPIEYNIRPVSIREKVKNRKDRLGKGHLEPRIYHMHNPDVSSLEEMEFMMKKRGENYRY